MLAGRQINEDLLITITDSSETVRASERTHSNCVIYPSKYDNAAIVNSLITTFLPRYELSRL